MANYTKRVPENVPGDFFVDSTCIDCDTCRQIAPEVFAEAREYAFVHWQPDSAQDRRVALQALVSCPTGSIGSRGPDRPQDVMDDFPLLIDGRVYYCGYNSPKSYGGNSYFIRHAGGNWLVDSPKFQRHLVKRLEAFGGVSRIFLTHRDDVADAELFAKHFGAERIIHRRELSSQPEAEIVLDGDEPIDLALGFRAIVTSGHTAGHMCLLFDRRYLFTGDHLWWNRDNRRLGASRAYNWYSWPKQIESMRKLAKESFEWVLPGHGQRVRLDRNEMKKHMGELVARMEQNSN
jgi:glyoxylase-like metal-dependent hydrolase (beta-lactamase superfamily II)/ferredoxin